MDVTLSRARSLAEQIDRPEYLVPVVDESLNAQMLATAGVWLACIPDAAKAFPTLFTVDGLKTARKTRGEGVFLTRNLLLEKHPHLAIFEYQTLGAPYGQWQHHINRAEYKVALSLAEQLEKIGEARSARRSANGRAFRSFDPVKTSPIFFPRPPIRIRLAIPLT
jgi:hypothetical protein